MSVPRHPSLQPTHQDPICSCVVRCSMSCHKLHPINPWVRSASFGLFSRGPLSLVFEKPVFSSERENTA